MERREEARRWHRMRVNFWKCGADKRYVGYTANISTGGMYIVSGHLLKQGTRIRIELCGPEHSLMFEAAVARVFRSPHSALHNVQPSGMGVRFLAVEELVTELVPEIGAPPKVTILPPDGIYQLEFQSRQQFLDTYRDLTAGNLFIPTQSPAPRHKLIQVELAFAEPGIEPVRFMAQVIHRVEPGMPDGSTGGNLIAGMGLEMLDLDATVKAVRGMAARMKRPSPPSGVG